MLRTLVVCRAFETLAAGLERNRVVQSVLALPLLNLVKNSWCAIFAELKSFFRAEKIGVSAQKVMFQTFSTDPKLGV